MKKLFFLLGLVCISIIAFGSSGNNNRLHLQAPAGDTLLNPSSAAPYPAQFNYYYSQALYAIYMRYYGPGLDTLLPPTSVSYWPSSYQYYYGQALYNIYLHTTTGGSGTNGITGTLTVNRIPIATGAHTLGDSWFYQTTDGIGDDTITVGDATHTDPVIGPFVKNVNASVWFKPQVGSFYSSDGINKMTINKRNCYLADGAGQNSVDAFNRALDVTGGSSILKWGTTGVNLVVSAAINLTKNSYISGVDTTHGLYFTKGGDTILLGMPNKTGIGITYDTVYLQAKGKISTNKSTITVDTNLVNIASVGNLQIHTSIPTGTISDNVLVLNSTGDVVKQVTQVSIGYNYLNDTITGSGSNPLLATKTGLNAKQNITPAWKAYNTVAYNDFNSGHNSTIITSGATVTFNSNNITVSGGTSGYARIQYTNGFYDASEQWSYEVGMNINNKTSTSYGVLIGKRSVNHNQSVNTNPMLYLDCSTAGTSGKLTVYFDSSDATPLAVSNNNITLSANDFVYVSWSKNFMSYMGTAWDSTSGTFASVYYNPSPYFYPEYNPGGTGVYYQTSPVLTTNAFAGSSVNYNENTGQFAIQVQYVTSVTIKQIRIREMAPANVPVVIVSPSFGQGVGSTDEKYTPHNWLTGYNKNKFAFVGGTGDNFAMANLDTTLINYLNPQVVVYWGNAFNSLYFGTSLTTLYSQIDIAAAWCARHNYAFRICGVPGYTTTNTNSKLLNSHLLTEFGSTKYIDLPTALDNPVNTLLDNCFSAGDLIHMNAQGYMVADQTMVPYVQPFIN